MSSYARRYDRYAIRKMEIDSLHLKEEIHKYSTIKNPSPKCIEKYINVHIDYVTLLLIKSFKMNFISNYEFEKFLDKIDGYYAAFESDLISAENLWHKINNEILLSPFSGQNLIFLGVPSDLY